MFEGVHATPDGDSTVARMALQASEYGYDGIVVRNHGDTEAEYNPDQIRTAYGIDVVEGVEIRAEDPSRASGFVGNHRETKTIVAVHGGSVAINRFAVEQPAVDVLAHPMVGDGDFNHVLAKEAARNEVHVELSLSRVLRADGGARVQALRDLRKLRELLADAGAPFVVSVDPTSHLQLRSPRDLQAVGDVLGFDDGTIETGLAAWRELAERNRRRATDSFVEPGVWLEDEE